MIVLMKRKMDLLKAMETFVKVVEYGSFSAVSRELNIVTSAVSRQVAELEAHFSCQLLYRTTRAMHLTAEGERYIEEFKEIISKVSNLENNADDNNTNLTGKITVSAPRGSEFLGFIDSASEFMKHNPNVKISWLFVNRYVNMVEEGIDLSVRMGDLPDSNYIARAYGNVNVNFVTSPNYLKQHAEPIHPRELAEHLCIIDSSNRQPNRWRFCDNGKDSHVKVANHTDVNDGSIAAKLAANGNGIAYLPTFLTQPYLDSGALVSVLQKFEFNSLPVSLVYPANLMMNKTLKAFVQFLLENKHQKIKKK